MRALEAEAKIRAPRSDRQRATIAFGIALIGFVALQLTAETYTPVAPLWRVGTATVAFCSLGVPLLALVLGGFGRLSLALPVGYFLTSALLGSISEGRLALYTTWMPGLGSSEPLESAPWLRLATYVVLLALPVLVLTSRRRRPPMSKPDIEHLPALIVTGSVVVSFVLTYGAYYGQSLVTPSLGGLIAGGLLLAFRITTAPVVGSVVGMFASGLFVYLVSIAAYGADNLYRQGLIQYGGLALIPVALGLTPALTDLLRRAVHRPRALLLVVNALNLMDAILTWVGRSNGTLEEANPIVAWSGLVPKVLLVGALSALVYRLRPRWLVVPVGVFAGLILYHLAGSIL
jgi:uncharacterized protein DUF5658